MESKDPTWTLFWKKQLLALCHSLNVFTTPGTNNGMMPIMQENRNPHKYPQKYKNLKKN